MKKELGRIIAAAGFIGVAYFGYMYFQDSTTFNAFGADIAISTGDHVPIIISGVVLLLGVAITRSK